MPLACAHLQRQIGEVLEHLAPDAVADVVEMRVALHALQKDGARKGRSRR